MTHPLVQEAASVVGDGVSAAFFDLDRTLVHGYTANAFVGERVRAGQVGPLTAARTLRDAVSFQAGRLGFSSFLTRAAELYAGEDEQVLVEIGETLFRKRVSSQVYPEAYDLVKAHQAQGRKVVIVTSATRYQADPVVRALRADALLCSAFQIVDGKVTGEVERPTCYGVGKLRAAQAWGAENGVDVSKSWFYSDGIEDLPLLEGVRYPRPLNADRPLTREAERRGWPVTRLESRSIGAREVVRTGAGVASLLASAVAGLPVLALGGDVETARNLTETLFGEVGTLLSGIELDVVGEEHLWSSRPCVFVFNHQSAVEPMLLAKLLRRDFVGIAKKELKGSVFRPLFDYAGTVYVDRVDRDKAIEALAPVVQALHDGQSVVMAPEGTRSRTPEPGPFKKGAFHIAMQAGVPIVPIVFHNSLAALPKKGRVVHAATVRVTVLPPVSTEGWTADDVGVHAEALRAEYVRVLRG